MQERRGQKKNNNKIKSVNSEFTEFRIQFGIEFEIGISHFEIEFGWKNFSQNFKNFRFQTTELPLSKIERYCTKENECTWIIDNSSVVQAVDEPEPPAFPPIFTFTSFNKLHRHIDDNTEISKHLNSFFSSALYRGIFVLLTFCLCFFFELLELVIAYCKP